MHAPDIPGTNEGISVERWNRVPREIYGPAAEVRGERIPRDGTWATSDLDRTRYLWRHTAKTARARTFGAMFDADGNVLAGSVQPYVFALPRIGVIRRIACYDYRHQLDVLGVGAGPAHHIRVQILDAAGVFVSTVVGAPNLVPFDTRNLSVTVQPIGIGGNLIEVAAVTSGGVVMDSILRVHFEFAMSFGTIPA